MRSKPTGWQTLGDVASNSAMRGTVLSGSIRAEAARTEAPTAWRSLETESRSGGFNGGLPNDPRDRTLERLRASMQAQNDASELDSQYPFTGHMVMILRDPM